MISRLTVTVSVVVVVVFVVDFTLVQRHIRIILKTIMLLMVRMVRMEPAGTTLAEAKTTTLHVSFELGRAGFLAGRVVVDCSSKVGMKSLDKAMFPSYSRRTRTAPTSVVGRGGGRRAVVIGRERESFQNESSVFD